MDNKDILILDGVELSKEEIECVRAKRRLKALAQLEQKLFNVCMQVIKQWFDYSSITGAGLSYTTFTHVNEFNINQKLANMRAEEFLEIREHLFEVVKNILEDIKKAIKDVSDTTFGSILDSQG